MELLVVDEALHEALAEAPVIIGMAKLIDIPSERLFEEDMDHEVDRSCFSVPENSKL